MSLVHDNEMGNTEYQIYSNQPKEVVLLVVLDPDHHHHDYVRPPLPGQCVLRCVGTTLKN